MDIRWWVVDVCQMISIARRQKCGTSGERYACFMEPTPRFVICIREPTEMWEID